MSNRRQRQRQTQKRRKQRKQQQQQQDGGMSTSEWGVKTFGDMGQQSAIPGSNVLQVHSMAGGQGVQLPPTGSASGQAGGEGVQLPVATGSQAGGAGPLLATVLNPEVLTPVVLTLASNQASKRWGKSRKQRGGNLTNVAVPALLVLGSNMLSKTLRRKGK